MSSQAGICTNITERVPARQETGPPDRAISFVPEGLCPPRPELAPMVCTREGLFDEEEPYAAIEE